jgi:hypothetical protein
VVVRGSGAPPLPTKEKPPGIIRGPYGRREPMIWNIVGILVALPASMVAAIELYRLLKPGRGRHRKR